MFDANGRCTVAEAADAHPGFLAQQCAYELQHSTALKYVITVAELGHGAMATAVVNMPPPQETRSSNASVERQERDVAAAAEGVAATASVGTCTTLDEHVVSALELASTAMHPAKFTPLRRLSRPLNRKAAEFVPASARASTTRAFRRRHRRTRRNCAAQTASHQTLDVLGAYARRMVSCSAEQTAALEQPVSFSADQLLALNLPALAHKRGGAHMRRLALRERMRAQAPRLQAAARRWLARRRLDRLRADRERTERRRVQQEAHEAAAQLALQILQTAEPCPPYPTVDSLSEWAVSVEAWLNGAGLGAAITQTSITSSLSTLSFETQLACRSLSLKLQQALGYFKLGVLKTVAQKWGPGNGMHGGRLWEAVMGGIKTPAATEHRPPWRRAQWSNGRGRGRQVPRQSGTL